MYFEEAIVNGVLSHRGAPEGEWTPYTAQQLTVRLRGVARIAMELREHVYIWEVVS